MTDRVKGVYYYSDPPRVPFLAPPAKRQRSFSNAELSFVNFSLKIFISQKLLYNFFSSLACRLALLGRYQCTVKSWIWWNRPKGLF